MGEEDKKPINKKNKADKYIRVLDVWRFGLVCMSFMFVFWIVAWGCSYTCNHSPVEAFESIKGAFTTTQPSLKGD